MYLRALIALTFFGTTQLASANTLSCSTSPGNFICDKFDDALLDVNSYCSGNPCYELEETEANDLASALDAIEQSVSPRSQIAASLGLKARQLAQAICAETINNMGNAAYLAFDQENKILPHLLRIQRQAHLPWVKTCNQYVN